MRPGGIAGAADIPYKLPLRYIFPTCHRQRRQMPISRNPTIPMLNEHTIAKGPHSTHAVCWCPSVLRVANSPGRYRIDRLAVTVGKGDVNAFMAEVGVPRKVKGALGIQLSKSKRGNKRKPSLSKPKSEDFERIIFQKFFGASTKDVFYGH